VSMVQIAASIEYETAPPPADLPDDMKALPGASLQFLSLKAIDGFKVQAALWQPENKPPVETTMIVQVHGSGGNLASLSLRALARGLSAKGYAALSISTRQHDSTSTPTFSSTCVATSRLPSRLLGRLATGPLCF
jgi:hypothetical protein